MNANNSDITCLLWSRAPCPTPVRAHYCTMQYVLPGLVGNYMNEKVLTSRDVFPADEVKLHLGLTGTNAQKCFMEL